MTIADQDDAIGYIAFRNDEKNEVRSFVVTPDRAILERWKAGTAGTTGARKRAGIDGDPPKSIEGRKQESNSRSDEGRKLLERFLKGMSSSRSMIAFTSVIGPMVSYGFLENELLPYAVKNLTLVEKNEQGSVYSYSNRQFSDTNKIVNKYREIKDGHDALPGATLLSLVATFDSYFSEIVRFFLAFHPERYMTGDRQISLKEVFSKKSLEEVTAHVIETEINDLMRGSHTEQVVFVEKHLKVSIVEHYERWPNFVEIFERRNLVAHGNLVVNQIYLDRCRDAKLARSLSDLTP